MYLCCSSFEAICIRNERRAVPHLLSSRFANRQGKRVFWFAIRQSQQSQIPASGLNQTCGRGTVFVDSCNFLESSINSPLTSATSTTATHPSRFLCQYP